MNDQARAEQEALQLRWENLLLRLNAINNIYELDGSEIRTNIIDYRKNAVVTIHRERVFTESWIRENKHAIRLKVSAVAGYNGKLDDLKANKLRKDFSEVDVTALDKRVIEMLTDASKILKEDGEYKPIKEDNKKFVISNFEGVELETYSRSEFQTTFEYRGYSFIIHGEKRIKFSDDNYSKNPKYLRYKELTVEQIKEVISTLIEQETEILNILGEES
jgi:hypothetical protein